MKTVTIYGASDDLVEVEGVPGADEFGAYSSRAHVGYFELISESTMGRLRVHCIYDGCWHFSFGQVEEGDPWPQWPISTTFDGYSAKHSIEVPDDTTCTDLRDPMR